MSWKTPGRSFNTRNFMLNITGCDFDVYMVDNSNEPTLRCTTSCPDGRITEAVAKENCNGTGCCSFIEDALLTTIKLRFDRHNKTKLKSLDGGPLWDRITLSSDQTELSWAIVDQPNCASTEGNKSNYACISSDSSCTDQSNLLIKYGYICRCNDGYFGNPFILHGCSRDKGIDSTPRTVASTTLIDTPTGWEITHTQPNFLLSSKVELPASLLSSYGIKFQIKLNCETVYFQHASTVLRSV